MSIWVWLRLPSTLAKQDKEKCLSEYSKARSHLLSYLTLKLAHWTSPPWSLYLLAHSDEDMGRSACSKLLRQRYRHHMVQATSSPSLREEALAWIGGRSLWDDACGDLFLFVARLKFAFVAERKVEGQHRFVKMRGLSSPCHSCPYVSFALRKQELAQNVFNNPIGLQTSQP